MSGLYLQNALSLDPPAAARQSLLSDWDAGLGLLGSPSDSSAGPEGDNPRMLPLSSLGKKAYVSLKFSVLSLLTNRQGLSWVPSEHQGQKLGPVATLGGSTWAQLWPRAETEGVGWQCQSSEDSLASRHSRS